MLENVGSQVVSQHWWMLALRGVLAIIFGLIALLFPGIGLLSILWLVGVYGIIFGILFIVRAFQLRSWAASAMA